MATFRTADVERVRPDEDFTVECVSGEKYVFPHPKSIAALELLSLTTTDPVAMFSALLGDDFDAFMAEPEIDGFALDQISEAWLAHYDLNVDPGNGRGSRKSSTGTRKR